MYIDFIAITGIDACTRIDTFQSDTNTNRLTVSMHLA